jgi:hypothetical protein
MNIFSGIRKRKEEIEPIVRMKKERNDVFLLFVSSNGYSNK